MNLKKLTSLLVIFCLLSTILLCINVSASDKITVMVDDVELKFDVAPELVNGRTMVPFRLIFEALGAKISYDASTSEVTAERMWNGNPEDATPGKYITPAYVKLKIGSNKMETVMDQKLTTVSLDAAPYIKNGRTLVPARAISESFGADVFWDNDTKTVLIYSNNFFQETQMVGSNITASDIWRDDTYIFHNGKLYFTFNKYQKMHFDSFKTDYVWDGYHLYEGKLTSTGDAMAFDKVNNKLFCSSAGDYSETSKGYTDNINYFTINFDGQNSELIAREKTEGFWNKDGHTSDPENDIKTLTIYSRPELWGYIDDDNSIISRLTQTGTYTYNDENMPDFLTRVRSEYNNTREFSKQAGAKVSGDTLTYSSAIDGSTKSVELPIPDLSKQSVYIVFQTPRYIFVKALVYRNPKTYFNCLYALDRFEDKLTPIMTISADLDNEGFPSSDGSFSNSSSAGTAGRTCSYCFGNGYKECSVCDGSGKVKKYTFYERTVSCPGCNGNGKKRCVVCGGDGNSGN